MQVALAFRAFFATLFRRETADRVRLALDPSKSNESLRHLEPPTVVAGSTKPVVTDVKQAATTAASNKSSSSKASFRSDAIMLLSSLQRDARLLDLVSESLDNYSDAQIGAAARDVLRDTKKSLDRMFGLAPLVDVDEGSELNLPESRTPMRWRVIGNADAKRGTLAHRGWVATKVELPQWTGSADDALVIAAAEVETRV